MARHIILEGVDKTGKSTLAKYLSEALSMPIKKFSAPTENPYKEYYEFIQLEKVPHIIDRFYMSEIAYGPVKRGKSYINGKEMYDLEKLCDYNEVFPIYCSDTYENIKRRFKEDKEEFTKDTEIKVLLQAYSNAMEYSILDWSPYTIGDPMKDILDLYIESL